VLCVSLSRRAPLRARVRLAAAAILVLVASSAGAAEKQLPRFVTLRADEVNLRTGPGERYPIDWVLIRKGLPVEIVEEFDVWRKIRDFQGSEGWVHQRMLTGARNVLVEGAVRVLHVQPDLASPAAARAEVGVVARLIECPRGPWCRVEAQGIKGWLKRDEVWGVYPDEAVQ
jgi:SH3-like domain-containing protein